MPDTSKLEKLNRELEKSEKKLRKAINDEKALQHQLKQLTRKERTHRLCTRGGMLESFMNQCISGWRYFPNPRMFSEYGRQKGWERENPATDSGNPSEKTMDGFVEVTEQMELPF